MNLRIGIRAFLAMSLASAAAADEQMTPLSVSGTWVAAAHQRGLTAPPDICGVVDTVTHIGLWTDGGPVQFRVANDDWVLPPRVHGQVTISIADWATTVEISDNYGTVVMAALSAKQRDELLRNMDRGRAMSVKVGNAAPVRVSLAGAKRATDAWRACVGLGGGSPGSNPFR